MSEVNADKKKRVLIIEDDRELLKPLAAVLRTGYPNLDVLEVSDAGQALKTLRESESGHPQALLLDLMMPYGDARQELETTPDPEEWMTGLRLLKWLRQQDQALDRPPIWVAIITALSPLRVRDYAVHDAAGHLLSDNVKVYYKPLDTLELEGDLMRALGVPYDFPEANQAGTEDEQ